MLAHVEIGSGETGLVLVHGFLGAGRNLATLARRLSEAAPGLRIVVPDLTGHGESPPLPPGADLETLASDLLATAAALELPSPLWIAGHSLGGRVALMARRLAKARVGAVDLLDIAPSPIVAPESGPVLAALRAAPAAGESREVFRAPLLAAGLPGPIVEWLLTNVVRRDGALAWRIDREALAAFHARANPVDLWDVPGPGLRLRCLRGDRSRYVSEADASRLSAAGAEVRTIAAGHFLHVDAPDEVLAFLRAGAPAA